MTITSLNTLKEAESALSGLTEPIPYITVTNSYGWREKPDITLMHILSKAKRLLAGKTKLNRQIEIKTFYNYEAGSLSTADHIHALIHISGLADPQPFYFLLWEMIGADKTGNRYDEFPLPWPGDENKFNWLNGYPAEFQISDNRVLRLPLKAQAFQKLNNHMQMVEPQNYKRILEYGMKSEYAEIKAGESVQSYSGYWAA